MSLKQAIKKKRQLLPNSTISVLSVASIDCGLFPPVSLLALIAKYTNPPPPPPPPEPTIGDVYVTLQKQSTYLYSGDSADPLAIYASKHAKIQGVMLTFPAQLLNGASITLKHTDRLNQVTIPIVMTQTNVTTDWFDAMEVEGPWSAQYNDPVSQSQAPPYVTIRVHWIKL
jgi:hypothetical protein